MTCYLYTGDSSGDDSTQAIQKSLVKLKNSNSLSLSNRSRHRKSTSRARVAVSHLSHYMGAVNEEDNEDFSGIMTKQDSLKGLMTTANSSFGQHKPSLTVSKSTVSTVPVSMSDIDYDSDNTINTINSTNSQSSTSAVRNKSTSSTSGNNQSIGQRTTHNSYVNEMSNESKEVKNNHDSINSSPIFASTQSATARNRASMLPLLSTKNIEQKVTTLSPLSTSHLSSHNSSCGIPHSSSRSSSFNSSSINQGYSVNSTTRSIFHESTTHIQASNSSPSPSHINTNNFIPNQSSIAASHTSDSKIIPFHMQFNSIHSSNSFQRGELALSQDLNRNTATNDGQMKRYLVNENNKNYQSAFSSAISNASVVPQDNITSDISDNDDYNVENKASSTNTKAVIARRKRGKSFRNPTIPIINLNNSNNVVSNASGSGDMDDDKSVASNSSNVNCTPRSRASLLQRVNKKYCTVFNLLNFSNLIYIKLL